MQEIQDIIEQWKNKVTEMTDPIDEDNLTQDRHKHPLIIIQPYKSA